MITIEIYGKPFPQSRPNKKKDKAVIDDFIAGVMSQYKKPPLTGPLWLRLMFFMLRPKHHYLGRIPANDRIRPGASLWHISKPTTASLTSFVAESLNGILWENNSQIIHTEASKAFANSPADVRTIIKVQRWE